jgi:hypothetical protein
LEPLRVFHSCVGGALEALDDLFGES